MAVLILELTEEEARFTVSEVEERVCHMQRQCGVSRPREQQKKKILKKIV